jgi:hypothetical protein
VPFRGTVHGGTEVHSDSVLRVPPETGAVIHHLSHQNVAQWIEKTNRYTSRLDRERVSDEGRSLVRFAHERIDHWLSRTRDVSPGGYPEAVAVLRATYDLIDRLKIWEEERGLDAAAEFARICAWLDAQYLGLGIVRDRFGETVSAAPFSPRAVDEHEVLRRRLAHFRARHDALAVERDTQAAKAARLASDFQSLAQERDEIRRAGDAERVRAEQAEAAFSRVQAEAAAQRQRAEQAEAQLGSFQDELLRLQDEFGTLQDERRNLQDEFRKLQGEHHLLQGSLRTFLSGYLPRLRRHLLGQRP